MAWKLSVAYPISQFERGRFYSHTLGANAASGQKAITLAGFSGAEDVWQEGDIIKIGSSSDSTDNGKWEYNKVDTLSGTVLTVKDNLTYSYNNGDEISGIGHMLPQGFTLSRPASGFTVYGINSKHDVDGFLYQGYMNNVNSLWCKLAAGAASHSQIAINPKETGKLLSSTKYRLGLYYKQTNHVGSSGSTFFLDEDVFSTNVCSIDVSANSSTWKKVEATGITSTSVYSSTPYIRFRWEVGDSFDLFGIGLVYVTHASLSSASTNGVYTFPVDPIDVSFNENSRERFRRELYGRSTSLSSLKGERIKECRLSFDNATATFIQQLEILQYWQRLGWPLMLEPDITGEIPLFGYMNFVMRQRHWDVENRISLDFVFRGI